MTPPACQIRATSPVMPWLFADGPVSPWRVCFRLHKRLWHESDLPDGPCPGLGLRVRAQYRPFTCCQDYNEKSCKRVGGAIPIALRGELGIELSFSFCRFASSSPIRAALVSKAGASLRIDVV